MFGLPWQTVSSAVADLEAAISARPTHVSHYQLTLEPNTLFWHQPPPLPPEDDLWAMQTQGQALLADAGYEQYEVSAWAAPGRRCGHNLNYWTFGDYLGIGAGAHGKLTQPAAGRIRRRSKLRHPAAYLRATGDRVQAQNIVEDEARTFEFMLNALRLNDGFDRQLFEDRTGLAFAAAEPGLTRARARDLIGEDGGRWCPTELGWRFLNDLQAIFLPESDHD